MPFYFGKGKTAKVGLPKIFVDARPMRLPRVYHYIIVYVLSSTSEIGISIVHDRRIGSFKWPAENEFNFDILKI